MDMTEQFDNHDSFTHWFIIASLAGVEITDNVSAVPRDVTMQINGSEVNPIQAMKRLEEEFDRMVNEKARELLQQWKTDIMEPFEEKVEDITDALDQMITSKLKQTVKDKI